MIKNIHKCPLDTQEVYIQTNTNNLRLYSIEEYIETKELHDKKLECKYGHRLVFVNKKSKPHFRHKNGKGCGNPMTKWHSDWEKYFDETEVILKNNFELQIKERRADAVIKSCNLSVEFQHSSICKKDIDERKHDHKQHGNDIVWIINGDNVTVKNFVSFDSKGKVRGKELYLHFEFDPWKFESFKSYNSIYIDINGKIYQINPNTVRNRMIIVWKPVDKNKFIEFLKKGKHAELWPEKEPLQCRIFIKQQGAGNGKTYGIVQLLQDENFTHYKTFIYVTKQHSAKTVIHNEIKSQQKRELLSSDIKLNYSIKTKKYTSEGKSDKKIIIATIDSSMYSMGQEGMQRYYDKFRSIVEEIVEVGVNEGKISKRGRINFATGCFMNKETLFVIDEIQDLPSYYIKAILRIMMRSYVDVYVVGDKLQSISYINNSMGYLTESLIPHVHKVEFPKINKVNRFCHPELINFINNVVKFKGDNWNLPKISVGDYVNRKKEKMNIKEPYKIIYGKQTGTNQVKIREEVETLMKEFRREVEEGKRKPGDFLVVTPFTKNNILAEVFTLAIESFWIKKYGRTKDKNSRNPYYAFFHKSEEGNSINLDDSEYNCTRIVSCHSAKGDGRPVVFVVGFSEVSLFRFSNGKKNIIYESLLHVALTRAEEKLYFRVEETDNDIYDRIDEYETKIQGKITDFTPPKKIKLKDIIGWPKTEEVYCEKWMKLLEDEKLPEIKDDESSIIIDAKYHHIRYRSMIMNLKLRIATDKNIRHRNENGKMQQISTIFNIGLSKCSLSEHNIWGSYLNALEKINEKYEKIGPPYNTDIPILNLSKRQNDNYDHNYHIIKKFIGGIEEMEVENIGTVFNEGLLPKLRGNLKTKKFEEDQILCPLECIVLYYIEQVHRNGKFAEIRIKDLYEIIHIYRKYYKKGKNHKYCFCNKYFQGLGEKLENTTGKYICQEHFEKMPKFIKTYDELVENYPNIELNSDHYVFTGETDCFSLRNKFSFIGYDNKKRTVCIIYPIPKLNSLNYRKFMMEAIFNTYLIQNCRGENNRKRYKRKRVINAVLTLEGILYIYDIHKIVKDNRSLVKNNIREYMQGYYRIYNEKLYRHYKNSQILDEEKWLDYVDEIEGKQEDGENMFSPPKYFEKFCDKVEDKGIEWLQEKEERFIFQLNKICDEHIDLFLG